MDMWNAPPGGSQEFWDWLKRQYERNDAIERLIAQRHESGPGTHVLASEETIQAWDALIHDKTQHGESQ